MAAVSLFLSTKKMDTAAVIPFDLLRTLTAADKLKTAHAL